MYTCISYTPGGKHSKRHAWTRVSFQVAADGGGGQAIINEFKTLVREAHKAGIEVILDVVFNHTAEGNEQGPTISFR